MNDFFDNQDSSQEQSHYITAKRRFKGFWMPKEISCHPKLSSTEKMIYSEICGLDDPVKGCYASNSYFMMMFDISEYTIVTTIGNLKKLNLLYQESFDGRKRVLKTTPENALIGYLEKLENDFRKIQNDNSFKGDKNKTLKGIEEEIEIVKIDIKSRVVKNLYPELSKSYTIGTNTGTNSSKELISTACTSFSIQRNKTAPKPKEIKPPIQEHCIKRGTPCFNLCWEWNKDAKDLGYHKHSLEGENKTLLSIKKFYSQLIQGRFFLSKVFSPDWLKRNPKMKTAIDAWEVQNHKFTHEEIMKTLTVCKQYFLDGYWPQEKNNVPKSLSDMIYNPRTQTSWFLWAMVSPPGEIKNHLQEYKTGLNNIILGKIGEERTNRSVKIVDDCVRYLHQVWDKTTDYFDYNSSYCGSDFYNAYDTVESFVQGYIDWLDENEGWIGTITLDTFRSTCPLILKWFDSLRKEYDYADENFRIITN